MFPGLRWRGPRAGCRVQPSAGAPGAPGTQLVDQVSGSFGLTALLQKRVRELVKGQKPLFETRERKYIKIASEELERGLIELVPDEEQTEPACPALSARDPADSLWIRASLRSW